MKKLFFSFTGVIALLIIIAGFVTNTPNAPILRMPDSPAADCSSSSSYVPISYDPVTRQFVNKPSVVMIRKNVYSLTAAEITSIRTGVTNMTGLQLTNNNSWTYQAAIHGTYLNNNLPSWNMCQHNTQYFLSWHRMYLYFFERILRAQSHDPNLTLPYWDYQTNPVMPSAYRTPTTGNSLYHVRAASINAGGSLPSAIMTAINSALNLIPFTNFQSSLEGPHGSIHVAIGGPSGDMSDIQKAAQDPVFWLHHANIDRLWEVWLAKCNRRANPTTPANSAWMTHVFTFFDENGNAVNMTGSQVVNTASSLNYRYQVPSRTLCLYPYFPPIYRKYWLLKLPDPNPVMIREGLVRKSFRASNLDSLQVFMKQQNKRLFSFSDAAKPDRLFVELDNISVNKIPEGVIEVYLNLGATEKPTPQSKSFVGVVDLFSASHKMDMAGMPEMRGMSGHSLRINADVAAKALGLTVADLAKAELSFVVRGNTLNGREIKTNGDISIGGISFAADLAEK